MLTYPSRLDFIMKFIYVISDRQQDTLGGYICLSAMQISSESPILFDVCKTSFHLDTSVHSKLCPILTGNLFPCLLTVLFHLF